MDPIRTTEPEVPTDLSATNQTSNGTSPQEDTSLKQIRTYQGDVASAIKNQKESLVTIARQERAKNDSVSEVATELSSLGKKLLLILGSLVLIALAVGAGWFTYNEYLKKTAPPVSEAPASRLIPSASEANVDTSLLKRDSVLNILIDEEEKGVSGEVHHIILRKGAGDAAPLLNTTEFFTLMEMGAPSRLVRALDPLYMLGILGGATSSNFLIIKLDSFDIAFAGMLEWEATMLRDIGALFATRADLQSIDATSVFVDTADQNQDIRSIRGASGEVALLYAFLDEDTLIITDRLETLRVLIDRLTREKLTR